MTLTGSCGSLTRAPVKIATGEGEYNRFGFKRLITTHAADIMQADLGHAGGFTKGCEFLIWFKRGISLSRYSGIQLGCQCCR